MTRMQIGWLVAAAALLTAGCAGSTAPAVAPAATSEVAAAEADRTVDCPPLTRMKYPFLTCVEDAEGHVVFDAAPQIMTASQMPSLDPFVESDEYWGD